jgi:hypothetical protein
LQIHKTHIKQVHEKLKNFINSQLLDMNKLDLSDYLNSFNSRVDALNSYVNLSKMKKNDLELSKILTDKIQRE